MEKKGEDALEGIRSHSAFLLTPW